MGLLYIITLIILGISFMIFKKSDEKLNYIKWLIIFLVLLFAYNIVIGMVLGLLNITSYIWLLSLINLAFAVLLGYRAIKYNEIQKYYVRKLDIIAVCVLLGLFIVIFFKDLYIQKGDISHFAIDSAIHYRAAKHYSENLKIFVNTQDKTFFNFNVMQTGAYINNGIFMNIIHNIAKIDYVYIYQMFETLVLFLSGLSFYAVFVDKIKTKRGLVASLALFGLYIYGYPYNSWFYGFSYLSVGIMFSSMLIPVVELLYSDEKINRKFITPILVMLTIGLIFSYCLFVPAIFSAICIYCFLKDFTVNEKKILKVFRKTTLIVTSLLLIVTIVGICYLFIPTFFIEGQTNLVDALKEEGGIYSEKIRNFLVYIPFGVMYAIEIIKRIKNKSLRYIDIFSVVTMGFTAVFFIGNHFKLVSDYYLFKLYNIVWIVIFAITIDLVNEYIDEKIFNLGAITLLLLYPVFYVYVLVNKIIVTNIFTKYFLTVFIVYLILPGLLKKIDFSIVKLLPEKIKNFKYKDIYVTGATYTIIWCVFVCGWVLLKSGHVISEEDKHALPNLVGIYYSENCDYRKLVDFENNFNKNEIKIVNFARENLEDLNANNIELLTDGNYMRIWATAVLELDSENIPYQNFIEDMTPYTVKDAIGNKEKKYIVKLVKKDQTKLDLYREELKEIKEMNEIQILFENENGFVAKINR